MERQMKGRLGFEVHIFCGECWATVCSLCWIRNDENSGSHGMRKEAVWQRKKKQIQTNSFLTC